MMDRKLSILVPYDYTDEAEAALQYALGLARDLHADIHLLHVVSFDNTGSFKTQGPELETMPPDEVLFIEAAEKFKEKLRSVAERPECRDFVTKAFVKVESYEMETEDIINAKATDLIVMCTGGFTASREMFKTSISQQTVEDAEIPVIVIRRNTVYEPITHIIYASHFDDVFPEAGMHIGRFANALNAHIYILRVKKKDKMGTDEEDRNKIESLMREGGFANSSYTIHIHHHDDTVAGIQEFADQHQASLIAINSPQIGNFERFFVDNFVEKLINNSKTAVMLINLEC